jgi:hypothetical protein
MFTLTKAEMYTLTKAEMYTLTKAEMFILTQSGNTELVFKVHHYQDMYYQEMYRPGHLSSKCIKTELSSSSLKWRQNLLSR